MDPMYQIFNDASLTPLIQEAFLSLTVDGAFRATRLMGWSP